MRLIDTHAHLDEIEDLPIALIQAAAAGVTAIIAVGSDYESNQRTLEIAAQHDKLVFPALGLHPWQLGSMTSAEVEKTLHQIEDNTGKAIAIGEVGLDYHKRVRALVSKEEQQKVLKELAGLAVRYHKPILIHSRYAWQDALNLMVDSGVEQAVFHWFTGPSSVLRGIIAQGYFVSVTPAAEYHAEHRRAVREAPLSNLLLETDAPVQYGREERFTASTADVVRSLKAAAEIRGMDEAVLAEQTTENASKLFGLPDSVRGGLKIP